MLVAAVFRFGILLSDPIDPVTSSTIATRSRALPQVAVAPVLKPSWGNPAIFMKSAVTYPDPVITMFLIPVGLSCGRDVAWMLAPPHAQHLLGKSPPKKLFRLPSETHGAWMTPWRTFDGIQ